MQQHYPGDNVRLDNEDTQFGAVELKDAESEARARISPNGALVAALDVAASVATLHSAAKTVTTPGTPVALTAAQTYAWRVDIVAKAANTGRVCVGDATVHATNNRVAELRAGEAYTIECPPGARLDLAGVFVDATVAGEGVFFNYFVVA